MIAKGQQNRPRRVARPTVLIYGEGSNDEQWLKYLKSIYAKSASITIDNGGGGSPDGVIIKMTQRKEFGEYEKKYALIDTDREEYNVAKKRACKNKITIIGSNRCLETELLKIIGGVSSGVLKRAMANSSIAKSEFEKRCKYHNDKNYKKHFPKERLDIERKKSTWLDKSISIFE